MTNYQFHIYQIPNGSAYRDVRFEDVFQKNNAEQFQFQNDSEVYRGQLESSSREDALEALFDTFNIRQPEDFQGRSLSVSDVVILCTEAGGEYRYYFCKNMGWQDVTEACLAQYF